MAEPTDLMFDHLCAIRRDVAGIKGAMRAIRAEMTIMRQCLAGVATFRKPEHSDIAALKARVDRIERRLDLVD